MPSSNQRDPKKLYYVVPIAGIGINYGFKTNAKESTLNTCGATPVGASIPANLVIGANAPKPGRARKFITDEYESTFYNFNKYAALQADRWSVTLPRVRSGGSTALSRAVYVDVGGIKYAWNMPLSVYNAIQSDLSGLGVTVVAAGNDYVWGASIPKPPRVKSFLIGDNGRSTISTYCDPSRLDNLPEGWTTASSRVLPGDAGAV